MSEFFKKKELSEFLRKFLLEDPRRYNPAGRYVALAAFGKHPGWDDHVEDLGLETESLNLTKTLLYVNGIGGQIDSGAWEKLEAGQQLPGFKHVFLWQRAGQILLGRLWSSSDGKGRKKYPMVVCAHFMGVNLATALRLAMPALAALEEGCARSLSAEDVRRALEQQRASLREALASAETGGEYAPVPPTTLRQMVPAGDGAGREGFLRVLYLIQSQFGAYAPGNFIRNPAASGRARQARVQGSDFSLEDKLLFWSRFFLVHIDSTAPLLLTLPVEHSWLDITVGEPESSEFFCLRATPQALPTVNEVPYNLEEGFRKEASGFLESFASGATTPAKSSFATSHSTDTGHTRTGWRKWLGLGGSALWGVAAFLAELT